MSAYGEPWKVTTGYLEQNPTRVYIDAENLFRMSALASLKKEDMPFALRIVTCVNACAGMKNPASEITNLRSLEDEVHQLMVALEDDKMLLSGEILEAVCNALNPFLDEARLAVLREQDKRQHTDSSGSE